MLKTRSVNQSDGNLLPVRFAPVQLLYIITTSLPMWAKSKSLRKRSLNKEQEVFVLHKLVIAVS